MKKKIVKKSAKKVVKKVTKKTVKKTVKKAVKAVKKVKPIGRVTHFFDKIKVAIVKFEKPMKVGATVVFRGKDQDFEVTIGSMQHDHKPITVAPKGKEVGIKIGKKVKEGFEVFTK